MAGSLAEIVEASTARIEERSTNLDSVKESLQGEDHDDHTAQR